MQRRFYYYEGYAIKLLIYPIYVIKKLGLKEMIITNAYGGINISPQYFDAK
jgi:Purine nucleoside phosphorylase